MNSTAQQDPCYAKTRGIHDRGKAIPDGKLTLSGAVKEIIDLILMPESKL